MLHVQKVDGIGGAERHLLALLPALRSAGLDTAMLVLRTPRSRGFAEALAGRGVPVWSAPAGPDLNPRLAARIRRLLGGRRPDLVHTHLIHADLHALPVARSLGLPTVSTIHSAAYAVHPRRHRLPQRWATGNADRVIAVSHHVRHAVAGHVPARQARVIHLGIDPAPWAPDAGRRARNRARLGATEEQVVVGLASRLIPDKGHDLALDAFLRAAHRTPELTLAIAGRGPLETRLRQRAASAGEGRVSVLGFVEDMPGFLAACDVLLFPTTPRVGEGLGLTMLEAMASGLPVVAFATGPVPEVVEHEVTGLTVAPGDPVALEAALVRLARDPAARRRLGSAGLARVRERFSLATMVERTMAVYGELLAPGPGSGGR